MWNDLNILGEKFAQTEKEEDFNVLYPDLELFLKRMLNKRYPNNKFDYKKEVVQQTVVDIWTHIGQFDKTKGSFKTWAATILYRNYILLLRNYHRTRKEFSMSTLHGKFDNDFEDGYDKEGWSSHTQKEEDEQTIAMKTYDLEAEINELPKDVREVVMLKYLKHWSYKEIQELYPVPLNTLKTKVRRGRLMLKKRYEDRG